MSYTTSPATPDKSATTTTNTTAVIVGYTLPVLVIVGLFILIALHDLQAAVGVPLIAGIVGVHGGAAVANTTSNG